MSGTDRLRSARGSPASACKHAGVRIVSTSHFQPPNRLASGLDEGEFALPPVPMLTEEEVRETLAAYESRKACNRRRWPDPHVSTVGHPLLVSLAADYLRERGWRFSIQRSRPAPGRARGVDHRRTAPSDYEQPGRPAARTTLSGDAIDQRFHVRGARGGMAEVAPAVDRPREQLNRLLGAGSSATASGVSSSLLWSVVLAATTWAARLRSGVISVW